MGQMAVRAGMVLLVTILSAFGEPAGQEYPQIKAAVKPSAATVGEPLEYRVTVGGRNLKGIDVRLPEKRVFIPEPDKKKGEKEDGASRVPLYIIQDARKEDRSEGETVYLTIVVTLSYYRTGRQALPEIDILGSDGTRIGYKIPEVAIKAVNEKGEFQDIEPPLELGGNYRRLVYLALGLLALGGAVFGLLQYIRRRRASAVVPVEAVAPYAVFVREVELLKARGLLEAGQIGEFVTGLSDIFRRFLSSQFGFDALEMTNPEILRALENRLSALRYGRIYADVERILYLWDLAKFAEYAPPAEILLSNLDETTAAARRLSGE